MHSKKRSKMAAAFSLPYCPKMCSGDWPLIKQVEKLGMYLPLLSSRKEMGFSELYDAGQIKRHVIGHKSFPKKYSSKRKIPEY